MNNIETVQAIGNQVCEGCGPDRDCGEDSLVDCYRIQNALEILSKHTSQPDGSTGD